MANEIKTISGLAVASIKTVNGLAVANVKKVNQLNLVSGYAIGDSTLGGKIAYILQSGDPGYDAGVQHGLVIQNANVSSGRGWGCDGYLIISGTGASGSAIGTGNQNTIDIVTDCVENDAAKLCSDLSEGGYSDWYLPSRQELIAIGANRVTIGFSYGFYWTSTQTDELNANAVEIVAGYVDWGNYGKTNSYKVRAVRSF